MIRFRSPATGDVQMLDAHGKHLLSLIGKMDSSRGVITPAEMTEAISRLLAASTQDLHDQEQMQAQRATESDSDQAAADADRVGLAQRSFPLVQMLKRAQAAGEPVLWGV